VPPRRVQSRRGRHSGYDAAQGCRAFRSRCGTIGHDRERSSQLDDSRPHLGRAPLQSPHADHLAKRRRAQARVASRSAPRRTPTRSDAPGCRWRHLRHEQLESRACSRRAPRCAAVDVGSQGAARISGERLLRTRQSWRCRVELQSARRHDRWPPHRARCRQRLTRLGSDDGPSPQPSPASGSGSGPSPRSAPARRRGSGPSRRSAPARRKGRLAVPVREAME